jgi:riboflavin biosynthesis pyrimidine reductase
VAVIEYARLLPDPGTFGADELLDEIAPPADGPADRPYVLANFIASADGRAAFHGRSGALGDDGDRAIFHGLRERVDAVLAGTVTMATENYGRILGKPERRARRQAAGRSQEPLACLISRTGQFPLSIPLFAEPEARVVVFSPSQPDLAGVAADVTVVALDPAETRPLNAALRALRNDFGVELLLCEGGPTLFGSLVGEGIADELFLTVAPKLTGGVSGPAITGGPPLVELAPLQIRWLLTRDDSLYLRYAIA